MDQVPQTHEAGVFIPMIFKLHGSGPDHPVKVGNIIYGLFMAIHDCTRRSRRPPPGGGNRTMKLITVNPKIVKKANGLITIYGGRTEAQCLMANERTIDAVSNN